MGNQKSSAKLKVKQPKLQFVREPPEKTIIPLETDATFVAELNRSDVPVEWLRRGRIIQESEKYTILSDGAVHKLIVRNATTSDEVEYSCRAEDLITTSKLEIEGKSRIV